MELNDKKREMLEELIKQMHGMMAEEEEMPQEEEMEESQEEEQSEEQPEQPEEQPQPEEDSEEEYPEGEEGEDLKDMLKDFFKNGPGSPDAPAPKVGQMAKKPRGISVTEVEVVASKPKPKKRYKKRK